MDVHEPAAIKISADPAAASSPEVEAWGTFRGNEWANKGEVVAVSKKSAAQGGNKEVVWTFDARPAAGEKEYLIVRQGCMYPFPSNPRVFCSRFMVCYIC